MTARATHRGLKEAHLLLGDLDGIEAPPGHVQCEAAELPERVADALEQVGPLADEMGGAGVSPCLLVGQPTLRVDALTVGGTG